MNKIKLLDATIMIVGTLLMIMGFFYLAIKSNTVSVEQVNIVDTVIGSLNIKERLLEACTILNGRRGV